MFYDMFQLILDSGWPLHERKLCSGATNCTAMHKWTLAHRFPFCRRRSSSHNHDMFCWCFMHGCAQVQVDCIVDDSHSIVQHMCGIIAANIILLRSMWTISNNMVRINKNRPGRVQKHIFHFRSGSFLVETYSLNIFIPQSSLKNHVSGFKWKDSQNARHQVYTGTTSPNWIHGDVGNHRWENQRIPMGPPPNRRGIWPNYESHSATWTINNHTWQKLPDRKFYPITQNHSVLLKICSCCLLVGTPGVGLLHVEKETAHQCLTWFDMKKTGRKTRRLRNLV